MSEINIDPLAAAVRDLREAINKALQEFDAATGGALLAQVGAEAIEVTTMSDPVRRYQHYADVRIASIEAL